MRTTERNRLPDNRARGGGLREFLTVLFKYKSKIATVFLLSVVTGIAVSFLLPPVYAARSTVLIKMGRDYLGGPDGGPESGSSRTMLSLQQQEIMNAEIQIMSNRELVEKVVNTLKVEALYPKLAKNPPSRITPRDAA